MKDITNNEEMQSNILRLEFEEIQPKACKSVSNHLGPFSLDMHHKLR